jgi:ATP-dependent helicase/nuclease subunit A
MRSIRHMPAAVRARVEQARVRSEEEYRRLLYVGMTRAKDRLYVTGFSKVKRDPDLRWHPLVTRALEPEWREIRGADGAVSAYEWRPADDAAAPIIAVAAVNGAAAPEVPGWAREKAPPAPERLRMTPSKLAGLDEARPLPRAVARRIAEAAEAAALRGKLLHRLLEALPAHAPDQRQRVGADYLAGFARGADGEPMAEAERAALLAEVLAVMANAAFAPVFGPGSRAEVELAGRVRTAAGDAEISGRVDRLAVTAERVLVVDFKTNRPAPKSLADVPPAYAGQLALYRLLLRRLYPGRAIAAALLWTDTARLMEIPPAMLDAAEARVLRGKAGAV